MFLKKKHLLELAASADSATGLHADRTGSRWTFVPAAVRQTSGTVWIVGSCWINGLLGLQALFCVKFPVNQFSDSGVALNFHMNIGGSQSEIPTVWSPGDINHWRAEKCEVWSLGFTEHLRLWHKLLLWLFSFFFCWTCFHHYNHYKYKGIQ